MDSKTYTFNETQLVALATLLAAHGVVVDLTKDGEANEQGWDISWTFPSLTTVTITVKKHPFAEESFLWNKLQQIFTT